MKKKIYTISTAHLDTSWLWTQKETVETYLPRTLHFNFDYFKQYPSYKFNFEGSYRYELIEEYHPEDFEKLKEYVKSGNWNVTGSCFENGDTNIPSPEALIRNILYGNAFFKSAFNKKSNDIFLPDCFGFGRVLPQVMTHSGLIGFSSQKLSWGSSIEPPFEIGKWKAMDGSFVYTSLKPGNYSAVLKEVRSSNALEKLENNEKSTNIPFTMTYYGTGDRGGGPKQEAIDCVFNEIEKNSESDIEVVSGSMVEFFEDLKKADESIGSLEEFDREFLMSTHGAGSYTSRTASKMLNKKCENLLDISEKANSMSSILGLKEYPGEQFDFAWKRVLEHHFHDDITGTSFMECYKKNWNDYFLSINSAKDEYSSSIKAIERNFDTSKMSYPIMVFNPNQDTTTSTIKVSLSLPFDNVCVIDQDDVKYPALYKDGNLYFSAKIGGNTIKVFDVQKDDLATSSTALSITSNTLENERYKVLIDSDLNISSIYDKSLGIELLSSPIRYDLIRDYDSVEWPAWEIKYSDIVRKPYAYFKSGKARIIEDNPLKVSLEIKKVFNRSTLKTIISLEKDSNRVDVYNELLWHEGASNLKVSFPLSLSSAKGTYDIGLSKYDRGNNTEKLYEVPAQKFAKIENDNLGITIISDARQGFDKPRDNEIRMTAVHTPYTNYRHECSQHLLDFGLNIFSFSITSSKVDKDNSITEAEKFTKPLGVFKMGIHPGTFKKDITLFELSNNDARVMCFKKAISSNRYVLRVVDYYGKSPANVSCTLLRNIKKLYLSRGDEEIIKELDFKDNSFSFDLSSHEIKTFMIEFADNEVVNDFKYLDLPFDKIGITSNKNRSQSSLKNRISIPRELVKNNIISHKSISYKLTLDGNNTLEFNDQKIKVDKNYKYAYLLLMSQAKDGEYLINNKTAYIQNSFEKIGQWDLYGLREYGHTKKKAQAFTFTHYHKNDKDEILSDLYLYSVRVKIDSDTIILNKNKNLSLFAITLSNIDNEISFESDPSYTLKKRKFDFPLTREEIKYASEPFDQRIKDIFVDRRKTEYVDWYGGHCAQSPSDFYQLKVWEQNKKRREALKIED